MSHISSQTQSFIVIIINILTLIIARTTGVQKVVMNGDITHESYDSVLVGTGKQKGLESLSENRE